MLWNNLVLLSAWALMCYACGTLAFFCIYVLSVSIAGGAGIVLFTVQHNFNSSYASDDEHWITIPEPSKARAFWYCRAG